MNGLSRTVDQVGTGSRGGQDGGLATRCRTQPAQRWPIDWSPLALLLGTGRAAGWPRLGQGRLGQRRQELVPQRSRTEKAKQYTTAQARVYIQIDAHTAEQQQLITSNPLLGGAGTYALYWFVV